MGPMDLVDSEPAPGVQEELSRFGRRILRCFQVLCCFDAQDLGKAFAFGRQAASQAAEFDHHLPSCQGPRQFFTAHPSGGKAGSCDSCDLESIPYLFCGGLKSRTARLRELVQNSYQSALMEIYRN